MVSGKGEKFQSITNVKFEIEKSKRPSKLLSPSKEEDHKLQIVWRNIFTFALIHVLAVIGYYRVLFHSKIETILFAYLYSLVTTTLGINAGKINIFMCVVFAQFNCKFNLQIPI